MVMRVDQRDRARRVVPLARDCRHDVTV
jgi:hypothetical protein